MDSDMDSGVGLVLLLPVIFGLDLDSISDGLGLDSAKVVLNQKLLSREEWISVAFISVVVGYQLKHHLQLWPQQHLKLTA